MPFAMPRPVRAAFAALLMLGAADLADAKTFRLAINADASTLDPHAPTATRLTDDVSSCESRVGCGSRVWAAGAPLPSSPSSTRVHSRALCLN